jgi:hypothetical protein
MQVVGNAAKRSENFNGVSDKLKEELIKEVKPGELINLQLLNGSFDVVLGREGFGASHSISLNDRIYDPYAEEVKDKDDKVSYKGAYVLIGVPDPAGIDGNRVKKCKKHWVNSIAVGIAGNGSFQLSADNISDMETYEFLCLSNKNKDNPYRDKSKEAEYEVVYPEKIAAAQNEKDFKELQAKLTRYTKNNPEKAKELTALLPKEEKKKDAVTV